MHCLAIKTVFMWHQTSCLAEMGKCISFSAQTHSPVSRLGFVCNYTNKIPLTSAHQARHQILSVWGAKEVSQQTHFLTQENEQLRKEAAQGNAAGPTFTFWLQNAPNNKGFRGVPRFRVQGWLWVGLRLGAQVLCYHGFPYWALYLLLLLVGWSTLRRARGWYDPKALHI